MHKLMVADDNEENLYLLETLLKSYGYEVVSVFNGADALEKARRDPPYMIITDILMPVMDGFTLCREWKGDDRLKEIPLIFYTATYTDSKDEELALRLGADKFIRKPVRPDEFIKIIQGVIGEVEKGRVKAKVLNLGEETEIFRLYSERLVRKLEKKMLDLKTEITERERTQKRVEHLNNVLRAVRGVNQLIIKEKRPDVLIKGVCDNIIKTRSYYNAWIALLDENAKPILTAEAGLSENFLSILNQFKRGKLTACAQKALKQSEVVVTEDPLSTCTDCPLGKFYAGRGALTVRLEHSRKTYGLFSVSVPKDFVGDEEERLLFKEVASDVAFALYVSKSEEKVRQVQDELRQSERELRIRNQIADVFLFVPDDEMYAGVLEVVLEALESKFGIFGYIDEKGDLVCPSMTRDVWDQCRIPDKDIRFPREQWGESIWGRAMVGKEALYSNKPFKVPKGHIPITKALDVPIIHQGEAIGNFLVGNKETVYGEKERHLLENISNFIAPVLHARLQRDTRERDKRRLETQLRQAQKMEAIGTLAGGIAHDFNNILAAIIGYVELVKMKLPEDSEVLPDLDQILKSGFRAKSLVQQILAFSREQELKQRPLQLKYIVKESIKFLSSTLPTDIEIKEYIAEDVGIVNSDPTQMQQIIMNLCTNACHAMQKEGGIISVGLGNVELDDIASAQHMDLDPGIYLRLTVGDTGSGMTSEVMDRIFDPYFTTKDTGIGTGMGLPIVHGIVKNHDGGIIVYSEPGKGSTFHVYLPIVKEVEEQPEAREKETLLRGHERILFVDDEPALAELGKQMLERFGYEVTATASSIDALEMFRSQPDRFDLVMTDMVMPKIRGDRLAKKLVEIRPDIPIIICTGRSEQMSEEKTKRIGIKALVMKPYVMKDLASIVRKVIDGL